MSLGRGATRISEDERIIDEARATVDEVRDLWAINDRSNGAPMN